LGEAWRRSARAGAWASQESRHDGFARSCQASAHRAYQPDQAQRDFIAHLEQLDRLYGPKPGCVTKPVVLVLDNGPIHVSKITLAALDARAHWLTVEWLPKYSPELNDIEVVWHDLKAHHLAHKTFTDVETLDQEIHAAADALNRERNIDSLVKWRISA
jgi:transposase